MRCCYCKRTDLTEADFENRPEAASGKKYGCRRCNRLRHKAWQKKKVQNGFCYACRRRLAPEIGKRCTVCVAEAKKKYGQRTDAERLRLNKIAVKANKALKDEVYAAYGGYSCSCCGTETKEFLSIDHIKGDGKEHRKLVGGGGRGVALYAWLKRNNFPSGFRILCLNCNFSLGHFGYCPHRPQYRVKSPKRRTFKVAPKENQRGD